MATECVLGAEGGVEEGKCCWLQHQRPVGLDRQLQWQRRWDLLMWQRKTKAWRRDADSKYLRIQLDSKWEGKWRSLWKWAGSTVWWVIQSCVGWDGTRWVSYCSLWRPLTTFLRCWPLLKGRESSLTCCAAVSSGFFAKFAGWAGRRWFAVRRQPWCY